MFPDADRRPAYEETTPTPTRWRAATTQALYGPGGFFVAGGGPADHFRTSVNASPVLATALARLLDEVDAALGRPERLDVVDVGAGRGELLVALLGRRPPPADRIRFTAVELAPRPAGLPSEIGWVDTIPDGVTGLLVSTEWLDNVALDVAGWTDDGWRYLLVDPVTGEDTLGGPVDPPDAEWLDAWWPRRVVGERAEIGRSRDEAWADAVRRLDRGIALAVDYGHLADTRPGQGSLTGYRDGRQVPPVPDGSCDVTAHVAVDSVAAAGATVAGMPYSLVTQEEALRSLGVDGRRPPLALASTDPTGYVRALAAAGAAAELTDPSGLGGHWWLRQPVGVDGDRFVAR
ncbi:SAM-dependent methyltransferase [Micromonospora sp. SH-82]|uniref:SAM-dependent methyltransferase n=1 Tax=Micromonospora sp. SH-82 TaxID=3132938 RepID=UPI003EB93E4A